MMLLTKINPRLIVHRAYKRQEIVKRDTNALSMLAYSYLYDK